MRRFYTVASWQPVPKFGFHSTHLFLFAFLLPLHTSISLFMRIAYRAKHTYIDPSLGIHPADLAEQMYMRVSDLCEMRISIQRHWVRGTRFACHIFVCCQSIYTINIFRQSAKSQSLTWCRQTSERKITGIPKMPSAKISNSRRRGIANIREEHEVFLDFPCRNENLN